MATLEQGHVGLPFTGRDNCLPHTRFLERKSARASYILARSLSVAAAGRLRPAGGYRVKLRLSFGLVALQCLAICSAELAQEARPGDSAPSLETPAAEATTPLERTEGIRPLASADELAPLPPAPRSFAADRFLDDAPAGDGRRTLSAFPRNLARGVVGVISRDNLLPFAVGAGAAFASHGADTRVGRMLDGRCTSCGRTGASAGGLAVVPVVGALFLAGRFAPQGTFRAASYDFAAGGGRQRGLDGRAQGTRCTGSAPTAATTSRCLRATPRRPSAWRPSRSATTDGRSVCRRTCWPRASACRASSRTATT